MDLPLYSALFMHVSRGRSSNSAVSPSPFLPKMQLRIHSEVQGNTLLSDPDFHSSSSLPSPPPPPYPYFPSFFAGSLHLCLPQKVSHAILKLGQWERVRMGR